MDPGLVFSSCQPGVDTQTSLPMFLKQQNEMSVNELCTAVASPEMRNQVKAFMLSKGAYANSYAFPKDDEREVRVAQMGGLPTRQVPVSNICIKVGHWRSDKSLKREVDIQRVAADAGIAPKIYDFQVLSYAGSRCHATIAMERLTQPTYYR